MGELTPLTVEVAEADLADLQEWARNSERSVHSLLQEALQRYLARTRADYADLESAAQGPFYTLDEVKANLAAHRAERLRDRHAQAAE